MFSLLNTTIKITVIQLLLNSNFANNAFRKVKSIYIFPIIGIDIIKVKI